MRLTLCLPIAVSDKPHAPAFLRAMKAFGPYLDNRAMVMPTPSAYHDPVLRPVIDGLMALFSPENVSLEVMPNDFDGGEVNNWPYGPNCHFRMAVELMDLKNDTNPWIWMEPDVFPIRENWLKLVEEDYMKGGTPFRGMIERTRYVDTNVKTKQRVQRYDGSEHFVGAGIYPGQYLRYTCPIGGSPMASYRNPSKRIPFDVKCQFQHVPATQSPLWLHKPRTVNWKVEEATNGPTKLSCEDRQKDEFDLTYAGTHDVSKVCLIHGPKDDSLVEAIFGFLPPASTTPMSEGERAIIEEFEAKTEPLTPESRHTSEREYFLSEENDRLIDENTRLSQLNASLNQKLAEIEAYYRDKPEPAKTVALEAPAQPKKKLGRPASKKVGA